MTSGAVMGWLLRQSDCLISVFGAEFVQDRRHVVLDRSGRNVQTIRDLLIAQPLN
jgi:hypothetical protein